MPAGHHLIEHQEDTCFASGSPQRDQELRGCWYAAARTHHGLEDDGADLTGVRAKNADRLFCVVVVRQRDRYGCIGRTSAAYERQQSALIPASEGKNPG